MTLAEMLAAIQKRAFTGSGIGTAAGYVQTVLTAAEAVGFCRQFPGKSAKDLSALLKAASETFVYRPPGESLVSVTKAKRDGVVTFGTPVRKDAGKLTASSVMDFENILTTKGQDRDGDILHPKGGKVDPSAPLLWQHIPTEPIGKLVQVVEQDDDHIKTHCAIANTPLGADAAALVEFGALRISHGFKPLKWAALSGDGDDGMIKGWEVEEFEVMEISLVSVPANVGAVITAFSRQKLHSPLIKSWAERMYDERPAMVRSGFGGTWNKGGKTAPVIVNVNLGDKAKGKKDDDKPKPKDDDKGKPKKGDEPPKKDDDDTPDPDAKAGNILSDVAQRAADMADDDSLSSEVRARCSVVAGILADVGAGITTAMDQISQCAQSQDLAGLVAAQQELTANCGKRLQRAAAELASLLQAGEDLDEGAAGAIQEMAESISASLSGIIPAGQDQDGAEGGTGDWVQLDGEGDADKDDDEAEEKDDDEEEEEEEKDEDDEDSDDKDDESEEEKDDDEEDDKDDESEEEKDEDDDEDDEEDDDDEEDKDEESDDEKDDADGSIDTGVDPSKDDDDDEREDDDEEEKDADDDEEEEKSDDLDDDEEKDADDDADEKEKSDDDDDDEPAPKPKAKPKAKAKPKKPKGVNLNAMAAKLVAETLAGDPINLKDHRQLAGLIVAGGKIDPDTLLMYRRVCGVVLKQLAARPPKKK